MTRGELIKKERKVLKEFEKNPDNYNRGRLNMLQEIIRELRGNKI